MTHENASTKIQIDDEDEIVETEDACSLDSSIELKDAIIDNTWFGPADFHSKKPTGIKWTRKVLEAEARGQNEVAVQSKSCFHRWWQRWQDKVLLKRLDEYDLDEAKSFVAQKLFKIDNIICDQQTKLLLIEKMVLCPSTNTSEDDYGELKAKYGSQMADWLRDHLVPYVNDSENVIQRAFKDFDALKRFDPLCNWYRLNSESCARMLERVQNLVATMANMVRYSLLLEPGSITPHLTAYAAEFHQLKTFFERNEMTPSEAAQTAFFSNYLTKSRNKYIECADSSRVILRPLDGAEIKADNRPSEDAAATDSALFSDNDDVPPLFRPAATYGTADFIHASYVRGGPLLNTFICTQAPMSSTIVDFWHMVWQENSRLIIMLCNAVNDDQMGLLDSSIPSCCPYYWPKLEGDEMHCGSFLIRNERIDGTIDPLFNVTYLSLRRVDGLNNEVHLIEHWQYDWRDFYDAYWPMRILRRARLSPYPTVVQCLDGCARSGTLVTIEALLMHLLRGSANYDKLVLTTALFVRLQRRHAIGTPLQYLYIYRVLLHWMQPYVTSYAHRFYLGLIFPSWGFIGQYNKIILRHSPR
uniref:Tyrosine-protein phosphatase domain-containing protein n=1 Tax=Syphacia muris TaxID=451379 RepID=A0A0N5ALA3_9BILA